MMLRRLVLIGSMSCVVALLALANPALAGGPADTWSGTVTGGDQGGTDHHMNLFGSYSIMSGTGASGSFSGFTSSWDSSNNLISGQMVLNSLSVVHFTSGKISKGSKADLKGTEESGPVVTVTMVATNGTSLDPQTDGTFDANVLIKVW